MKYLIFTLLLITLHSPLIAQERDTIPEDRGAVERLKYKQAPGLALAASKIYFSDKRYSISGFGEASFVNYQGPKDTQAGDLELYYTNLYRFATFFGYRLRDNLIWNSEIQIEYLHDGTNESHTEFVFEAFVDYLWQDYLNVRFGFLPLPIGYVNNNDEPVMFYSVNRSEVERLINPTTWIELGAMFYGSLGADWSYALGVSQGLNASQYLSGTWIRQGREITFNIPRRLSFTPQITYTGIPDLEMSASGFIGNSGKDHTVMANGVERNIDAPVRILTGFVKYDWGNWRFVSVGSTGSLGQTEEIFELTRQSEGIPQVMGTSTYGYLFELGYNILPHFGKRKLPSEGFLHNTGEFKLPIFVRFERLNTHRRFNQDLARGINPIFPTNLTPNPGEQIGFTPSNLRIWTVGANFNPKENIVLKGNYQFRNNITDNPEALQEGNRIEFGFGFIF
ncbi:hypothetical protein KI659_15050 [Litoribacter alkaliphilus]|uniref:Porin n=1 Tax=Litoribacter ruber TaxID=702568 RepID=A0AAP2G5A6_9BACT|nr:hypothetical protein [Litoribacter alkaliphilus]MBS9525335.1 hypothetical protein [Litoribacter alkaliphilus]